MPTQASIDTIAAIGDRVLDKERRGRLKTYLSHGNAQQGVTLIEDNLFDAVKAGRIEKDEVEPLRRALDAAQAITYPTEPVAQAN